MRTLAIMIALALTSTTALAQYTGPSPMSGDKVTTVRQVLNSGKDDQIITVKGKIIKQVNGKHYVFSDGTGELKIELKDRVIPAGQTFNEKTNVILSGKLDKDWNEPIELEVKHMRFQ